MQAGAVTPFMWRPNPGFPHMLVKHSTNLAASSGSIDSILKRKYFRDIKCHKKSDLLEGGIKDINQLTYSV